MRSQWRLLRRNHRHNFLTPQTNSSSSSFKSPLNSSISEITSLYHCWFYSSSYYLNSPNSYFTIHSFHALSCLFTEKGRQHSRAKELLFRDVSILRDELVKVKGDSASVYRLLEQMGLPLFSSCYDGSALVELLAQLYFSPHLAVEVFKWRREYAGLCIPITSEEYAKGITLAGRARDVDIAVNIFNEAAANGVKTSSTYNALMGAYMVNGFPDKCQSLFREFRLDKSCYPTTVTYNILVSVFGRLMLMDHMEATLQEIYDSGLSPNVSTFNNLIAGYVTAWMWDRMENAYVIMKEKSVKPDGNTYILLLRGYAHSGYLEKMEEIYELGKHLFDKDNLHYIRTMICAYCKGSSSNRVEKIDALIKLIPEQDYLPWLNVLIINVYAQEQLLERMEKFINIAFKQKTTINTVRVMRSIITAYYHSNSVEKLSSFVKRAEIAEWRICRSLYHCKMVMYASQNRLKEMENVLAEMENINIDRTRKTWAILYKAYLSWGQKSKFEQIKGLMYKKYETSFNDCLL